MNNKLADAIEEIRKMRRSEADVAVRLAACPVDRLPEALAAIHAIDFAESAERAAWGSGGPHVKGWCEGALRARNLAVEALKEICGGA